MRQRATILTHPVAINHHTNFGRYCHMKHEHFEHVVEHLELNCYCIALPKNVAMWDFLYGERLTSSAFVKDAFFQTKRNGLYEVACITKSNVGEHSGKIAILFHYIPSRTLAEKICQYIRKTEILFV